MTAVPDIQEFRASIASADRLEPVSPYQLEEAYWGYSIRGSRSAPVWLMALQGMSWLLGVTFAVFAIGIWVLPNAGAAGSLLALKMGVTVPLAGVSALLLWFSSRGTQIEIQIDTNRGEVREVLRNRAGRSTLLGLYGFDSIGGVFMERGQQHSARHGGQVQLVLRYRNTAQVLRVARGPELMLEGLRDRLGRDLMVRKAETRRPNAVSPLLRKAAA